jgi:hypothetical protein
MVNENTNNKKNKVNITNNNTKLKIKGFETILSKCEIIMNFSFNNIKNMNNINVINENSIINFLMDSNQGNIKEDKILELFNYSEFINHKLDVNCRKAHIFPNYNNSSINSSKIIEQYFITKRNISKINFDDLFTLLRLSIFFSMLRFHYEGQKILIPITISNISYIDCFYSILLYEYFSQYKYGFENKIMGNVIEKILFIDYNELIDQVMNEIVNIGKTNNGKIINYIEKETIPSKLLKSKRIKLTNNFVENESIFFNDNWLNFREKNNKMNCNLCQQIDKIDIEYKNYLLDFLNKLDNILNNKN